MKSTVVRAFAVSVIALATALSAAAPTTAAPRGRAAAAPVLPSLETAAMLRDKALAGSMAFALTEDITTRFGPRPAGSRSERAAAEWGVERMKALGFTNVHLEEFPLVTWTRISESGAIVAPYPQPLVVTMLGGSNSTPADGIEADAVVFETLQDLKDAPAGSLDGKIAVVLQAIVRTQDGSGYGFANAIRSQGPSIAKTKGAVAFVMRALGTDDHRSVNTGSTRRTPDAVPGFAVSPPDAAQLRRVARAGGLRLKLNGQAVSAEGTSQNVVGDIVGREHPEQIIAVGGHLDSWDRGTGAIDDATGVAITTAAAKLIADSPIKPRRTIRVVWFGSEELSQPFVEPAPPGSLGGRAHAAHHKAELANYIAADESDFGAGRVYSLGLPTGWNGGWFQREAMRLLAPIGLTFARDPQDGAGGDFEALGELGVPGWNLKQDGSDYFDYHHTADDVLERVDARVLDQNVAAWVVMMWLTADSDVNFRKPAPDLPKPAK